MIAFDIFSNSLKKKKKSPLTKGWIPKYFKYFMIKNENQNRHF